MPTEASSLALAPTPSPAVAPPPGSPRFPLVDSLRAIAVLLVMAYHVTGLTGAIDGSRLGDLYAVLGNEGLVIFFIVSGFLLYRPYVSRHAAGRPRPGTGRYVWRRALRIVPAYWTALTLLAIVPGIVGAFSGDWWRYYFFLQAYTNRTIGGGIPPAWTMCAEVAYYVLLPVWAVVVREVTRRAGASRWRWTELLMIGALAVSGAAVQVTAARLAVSSLLATTLLGESVWFALGMGVAVMSIDDERREHAVGVVAIIRRFPTLCWIGAAGCLIGVAAVLRSGGLLNIIVSLREKQPYARTIGSLLLTGGFGTLLVAPAVFANASGGVPRKILGLRPLASLGLVSYGVYLYHLTLAELLGETSDPSHFSGSGLGLIADVHHLTTPIVFLLTLGASWAAAALSYRFIELPFLRLKER